MPGVVGTMCDVSMVDPAGGPGFKLDTVCVRHAVYEPAATSHHSYRRNVCCVDISPPRQLRSQASLPGGRVVDLHIVTSAPAARPASHHQPSCGESLDQPQRLKITFFVVGFCVAVTEAVVCAAGPGQTPQPPHRRVETALGLPADTRRPVALDTDQSNQ